jgi:hypothetical protein
MGVEKRPVVPGRIRRIPANFSWIDRRFIRERWIERLTREEALLYFFLVAVADKLGLSFYADPSIGALLRMTPAEVVAARSGLVGLDLIAFRPPLYQVLSLPEEARRAAAPESIGEVLRRLAGRGGAP